MASRRRKGEVKRCDAPPPIDTRFIPVISAKPDVTWHLTCLSPELVGVWTHYHLERTVPCVGRESGCICKSLRLAKRWKGYLCCWWVECERLGLAEVTIEAHRSNPKLFVAGRNLRGLHLNLFRLGAKRNSPCRIYEVGRASGDQLELLPPPVDVMRCLYSIWGIEYPK